MPVTTPQTRPAGMPSASLPNIKIWIDGELVDRADAKVSVFDHGLLYGDGCFEGIRVYAGRIFKMMSHITRLEHSAAAIRLKPVYSRAEIAAAMKETVRANGLVDGYIRLVHTRGAGSLGLNPFKCPVPGTIIIADSISLYPFELYEKGLELTVANRPRIPIVCLDPAIKSLNYLNNILAKVEAIDRGMLEAIMLNLNGEVAECTGDNIFIVKDGVVATPPTGAGILHGITRRFVLDEVAPACGFRAVERSMRMPDVFAADEVFLTGTAAEIIGVSRVDGKPIGRGVVGPVTRELAEKFRGIVRANAPED